MKTKEWFRNNKADWDALSEGTKRLLARHSPYPTVKEPRDTLNPERRKLLSLANGTRTVAELANILSLKPQTVRNKIWSLKKNGFAPVVKTAPMGRPWPKSKRRDEIILTSTKPVAAIAKQLGVAINTVRNVRRRNGWTSPVD